MLIRIGGIGKKRTREAASASTILIYRLGSIGDTVVALPCFHAIAKRFPDAKKIVLTNDPVSEKAAPLEQILSGSGLIHGTISYAISMRSLSRLNQLRKRIKASQSKTLVYFPAQRSRLGVLRDFVFFRLCGIRYFIGMSFKGESLKARIDSKTGLYENEAERLVRGLREIGHIPIENSEFWDMRLSAEELDRASAVLATLEPRKFFAINVGGKIKEKDWGTENWETLLRLLAQAASTYSIVFVGSADERDRCEQIARAWAGSYRNLSGSLTPRETCAVLGDAALFIGHDSGPMHLAANRGTPCIALFGSNNRPRRWHPWGGNHRVIHNLAGISYIDPVEVAAAVSSALSIELEKPQRQLDRISDDIHVVFVAPELSLGGLQYHLVGLANELNRAFRVRVSIILIGRNTDLEKTVHKDICIRALATRTLSVKAVYELIREIDQLKPHLVVGWSLYPSLICSLLRRFFSVPVVATELSYPPQAYRLNGRINALRTLIWSVYRNVDLVTANSDAGLCYLSDISGNTRLARIYNMVTNFDIGYEYLPPRNWLNAGCKIVAAGRLFNRAKGFDILIQAISLLNQKESGAQLLILGDGPDRVVLERMIDTLGLAGIVTIAPWAKNLAAIIEYADIFVMPSNYEGFGNVLIEAMTAGTIVLSSDLVTGPRELIRHRVTGYLFAPGSSEEIATTIQEIETLTQEHKSRIIAEARKTAKQYSTEQATRSYYENVILRVLARAPVRNAYTHHLGQNSEKSMLSSSENSEME